VLETIKSPGDGDAYSPPSNSDWSQPSQARPSTELALRGIQPSRFRGRARVRRIPNSGKKRVLENGIPATTRGRVCGFSGKPRLPNRNRRTREKNELTNKKNGTIGEEIGNGNWEKMELGRLSGTSKRCNLDDTKSSINTN